MGEIRKLDEIRKGWKLWIFALTRNHRDFSLSHDSESSALHGQIVAQSFIPPDSPSHRSMFCTTDLCCFLAHWLFCTWLAGIMVPFTFTILVPCPTLLSDSKESWREERANTMNQSFLQQFCFACQLRRVRRFLLLRAAILSSSASEGLSQIATLWSHNLQFYLHLCLIVQC